MEPNESISKLLRLKRYEQPPGEYFERFLGEFQLRQRAEVIHRPLFKVAWDRLRSAFTPPPIPRLALASSFAVAVLAGLSVFTWSGSEVDESPTVTATLASGQPIPSGAPQNAATPAKRLQTVQYVLPAEVVGYASKRTF
jgi:hypothetical protein